MVFDLNLSQDINVRRETVKLLTLVRVGGGNLQLVEVVEDVKLGEVERGVVVASV